ncbi:hypothetical protein [Kitasatospora purpeofusca]|uniref:Uncharacterized protein n=1 Tax=Kitasatospora purpeofusca TaxID=67352 RepID=A0ABZ1TUI7_9ACTN|nr:hypothetical protein [Kitasatospora purpeofusca]
MYPCTNLMTLSPAGHRHRMPWAPSETRRLTDLCAQGVGWSEIARLLGRTEAAAKAQAKKAVAGASSPAIVALPVVAIEVLPDTLPARMRGDELLEQRDRTGLTFEQMAARVGILSGPGILYVIAAGKNQLSPRYTLAIRDLPDARRAAPAPGVPAAPKTAPGFVSIAVPERIAAAIQVIVHAMGAQQ